tara:strand:+ start:163 stop:501 length:339 start_codon:yes stop_codon:yes gene_type:complete
MINDIILFDGSLLCQTRLEFEIDAVVKEFPYWNEIEDIFKILWVHLDEEWDSEYDPIGHIGRLHLPSYVRRYSLHDLMCMVPEMVKQYRYEQFEDMVSVAYAEYARENYKRR